MASRNERDGSGLLSCPFVGLTRERARERSSTITTRDDESEREREREKDVIDRRARFERDAKRLRRAGVTKSVGAPNARRSSARRLARGARDRRRRSAAPGGRGEPIVDA